ncbi:MAG: CDP-diacylglycerol--glycerol-3-phosphate 3-phosphatidyltransferase [Clostridia bacterium]
MNLPNKLTIFRIALIPLFVICFYIPVRCWEFIAAAVFVIAYATDMLDGHIARKNNIVTDFGKLMDPIADKLLTASALIMLTGIDMLSPIPTIIIIAREFIVSGLRLIAAGDGIVIAAGKLGKLKTITQCIAIVLTILQKSIAVLLHFRLDLVIMWIAVALTVISAIDFVLKNRKNFNFR